MKVPPLPKKLAFAASLVSAFAICPLVGHADDSRVELDAAFSAQAELESSYALDDLVAQADADATDAPPATQGDGDAVPTDDAGVPTFSFSRMLEQITVTARKRPEFADQIPVSISVLTRNDLAEQTARRVQDLQVPNLELESTIGFGNSGRTTLRGVGQFDVAATIDPGVGIYLDGVYLARPQTGLLALADLERVEVLRGPQGTIFGKNTIGGAINLITAKPQFQFGGEGTVRYGDFDELETRFSVNVPLVPERAAMRLSVATATRDGFQDNISGGADGDDEKLLAGRAQLRLLPTSDLEILLSGDLSIEDKEPQPASCLPAATLGSPVTLLGQVDLINGATGAAAPVGPAFAAACAERAQLEDRRRFRSDVSFLKDDLTSFGGAATINWDLGGDSMLTSITSSRGLRNRFRLDLDGTAIPITTQDDLGEFKQDQFSQEIQLASSLLDGRLRYLLGAYGFRESIENTAAGPDGLGIPIATLQLVNGMPGFVAQPFATRGEEFKTGSTSYSAFGQISYALTPDLELAAGLRFTHERKRFFRQSVITRSGFALSQLDPTNPNIAAQLVPTPVGTQVANFEFSERFTDFTPSASLTYRVNNDVLLYSSFSTGFKSGGFDGRDTNDAPEVDPEDLTTYEAGLKSSWLDGRVRLNAAYFYSIYKDIQLTVTTGNVLDPTDVVNAGKAIIRGGELELSLLPIENLLLTSSVGVLKTRYQEFDDNVIDPLTGMVTPVNRDNLDLPFAPNYSMRFAALYSVPLNFATVTLRADWVHKGAQALDVLNTEQLRQGKFGELGARVGITSNDGLTELAFYGRNLLDRDHFVSGFEQINSTGFVARFIAPPRTYGVELRRHF